MTKGTVPVVTLSRENVTLGTVPFVTLGGVDEMDTVIKRNPLERLFSFDMNRRRNYYIVYTVLFLLLTLLILGPALFSGKSMVWYADGMEQHYKAYIYWGDYLRSFFSSIFSGDYSGFREWDYALGEGGDILQAFQFYTIGDPFAFFSVLVPTDYMQYYYGFMIFLRLFLSGVAFSWLCKYVMPESDGWARVTGAICYAYCHWAVINVVRHPFFLNPMVLFPLIILGVEKIIRGEKMRVFIFSVVFAAIGNFYFFFQIVILTMIYVVVRLIFLYRKEIRKILLTIGKIAAAAAISAGISAALLLPTLYIYLQDSRSGIDFTTRLFYSKDYYEHSVGIIFGGTKPMCWLCIGLASAAILSLILLFQKRKTNGMLKCILILCLIFAIFPPIGQFFNGMSYESNRWTWMFALFGCFVMVKLWPDLFRMTRKQFRITATVLCICYALMFIFKYSRTESAFAGFACSLFVLLLLYPREGQTEEAEISLKRKLGVAFFTLLSVYVAAFYHISPEENALQNHLWDRNKVDESAETDIVQDMAKEDGVTDFYRYAGGYSKNSHTLAGISGPAYYWSVASSTTAEFMKKVGMVDSIQFNRWGHDTKTSVLEVGTVRYLLKTKDEYDNGIVPYGFTYAGDVYFNQAEMDDLKKEVEEELGQPLTETQLQILDNDYGIPVAKYKNEYTMPLGYVTTSVIPVKRWSAYSPLQIQECLMQGVLLGDDHPGDTDKYEIEPVFEEKALDYTIREADADVTMQDHAFVCTKAGASITLEFPAQKNSEMYVEFLNLECADSTAYELYHGDADKDPQNLYTKSSWEHLNVNTKYSMEQTEDNKNGMRDYSCEMQFVTNQKQKGSIKILTEKESYYAGIKDYSLNLGYSASAVNAIKIKFDKMGTYSFDSMKIYALPMDNYKKHYKALSATPLEDVKMEDDQFTGTVTAKKSGILCIAMPYAEGWKAYVDGEEVPIFTTNIKYMGIDIKKGKHEIKFTYRTPLIREGIYITAGSVAAYIIGCFVIFMLRRSKKKKETEA